MTLPYFFKKGTKKKGGKGKREKNVIEYRKNMMEERKKVSKKEKNTTENAGILRT